MGTATGTSSASTTDVSRVPPAGGPSAESAAAARYPMSMENTRSTSIAKRGLAVVVLVLAAFVLLKLIVVVATALVVPVLIIVAIVAIVWAVRTL